MVLFFSRYFCTLIGFAIILLMLYKAFSNLDDFQPLTAIEYSVPAIIFIGIAYRSYPKAGRETDQAQKRQLNS
jgi:hypothetical protein